MYHDGNWSCRMVRHPPPRRRHRGRPGPRDVHREGQGYIESRDMFFLATADEQGRPNVSYKGGDPGVVRVVDDHTLAFPSYNGNGMYLSMGNLLKNLASASCSSLRGATGCSERRRDPSISTTTRSRGGLRPVRGARARPRDLPELPALRASLREGGDAVFVRRENCETPVPHRREGLGRGRAPEGDPALDPNRTVV